MSKMNINQCTVTLTRKCNLRCNFCYAKKTKYLENDILEYNNLKSIIDFCNDGKVKFIVFTGGEPTLYPYLIDALRYINSKENKMLPTIATNGIRLEDLEFCKLLIDNGISYIDISLKGKDSKECYELVGRDCYQQQLTAIHNLASLPIEFTCSIVITEDNVHSLCETIRNACSYGAKQFSFTFVIDNEKSDYENEVYLNEHSPFALIETFISNIDELNAITEEWWIEYSFPICAYTEEQLGVLKGKLAAPCHIHIENGITFDTNMNLIPCNMYFQNKIGQLGVDFSSFTEFEEAAHNQIYRSTINKLKEYPSDNCKSCKYLDSCYGGCPVTWKNYSHDALMKCKRNYYGIF
ncbi:MAG: radical SAM protein, partial [Ruminococcus sp.]|nr:radical SAM protein [Ruminococcus sp.]